MAEIAGYRVLTQADKDLVNINKLMEERILRIIDNLAQTKGVDLRWLYEAKMSLERGFMEMNRAIMQPGRIALPGDPLPAAAQAPEVAPTAETKI